MSERAGRLLFRWRAVIGFAGFALVFATGRGTVVSCLAGLPLVLAGLGLRLWAMGYIGGHARAGEIGESPRKQGSRVPGFQGSGVGFRHSNPRPLDPLDPLPIRYVQDGPYRWFRLSPKSPAGHPLYAGNFLLAAGMLVAFWPPVGVGVIVIAGFLLEYWLIARAEERLLLRRFGAAPTGRANFDLRRSLVEWRTLAVTALCLGLALARAVLR